jgi:ATP-binding cassette subfamily B protein
MTSKKTIKRDREVTRTIHRLFWRAMTRDKKFFTLTMVCQPLAFFGVHVLVPLYIAYGIEAIVNRQPDRLPDIAMQVVVITLAYITFMAIASRSFNRNAAKGAAWLQQEVFDNYLSKDYEFYVNTFVGSLGSQASSMREAFTEYARIMAFLVPKQVVSIFAGLVVIGFQSPLLAAITLACVTVVLSYNLATSAYRTRYRRLLSQAGHELSGAMSDALGHGSTVKSFALERYENNRIQAAIKPWQQAQTKAWDTHTPANTGRHLLNTITVVGLLLTTGWLYQRGSITIAIVALVQMYVIKLVASTIEIADLMKLYETVMGMAYQPAVTMLVKSHIADPITAKTIPKRAANTLEFDHVRFTYDEGSGQKEAIHDFNLLIAEGEKIGLVGYSGSGKTTLTKLLLRFMDVTSGSVKVCGVNIRDVRQHDVRTRIAYVPQEPLLFHRTIAENIAYGDPTAIEQKVLKAAKHAYVDEFVDELPKGYDTLVGERGVKLSGGQRQRVAIARAILKDAPILVLDEATSALDSRSERLIQEALWNLMENRTTLVIAHRLSTIQRMDRIIVMDKGRIVQTGTHKSLLKDQTGIYAELWAHQSGGYIGLPTESDEDE